MNTSFKENAFTRNYTLLLFNYFPSSLRVHTRLGVTDVQAFELLSNFLGSQALLQFRAVQHGHQGDAFSVSN